MKIFHYFICILLLFSCKRKKNSRELLHENEFNEVYASIESSFKVIIEKQLKVFHSQNKKTKINPQYKSQNNSLEDLLKKETTMVVLARDLKEEEKEIFFSNFSYYPKSIKLASQPILMLVHSNQEKKNFSAKELAKILENSKSKFQIIIEGSSSDAIIYELLNFTKAKQISQKVKKTTKKKDFFTFLSLRENTIGFITLNSFLSEENSKTYTIENIKLAGLSSSLDFKKGIFRKPYEKNLINENYPLMNSIFAILRENYTSPGKKFFIFLSGESAQLIFRKSGFIPAQRSFKSRRASLN